MSGTARDGILLVDKPRGPTSHDVVARARKTLDERRVGHTGTLDPFATGLLLLCVGGATRLSQYLTGLDKTYEAEARLGVATDTLDVDGEVVAESDGWQALDADRVEAGLAGLRGEQRQVPPQYSAKKVGGVAMHRRARKGETVALEARPVVIHELELTEVDLPEIRFRVRCSSGTYVRALARDLGEALGVGAHLTALRRTAVGSFRVEDALPLADLRDGEGVPDDAWVAPLDALGHLPRVEVEEDVAAALAHGRILEWEGEDRPEPLVVAHEGELVAVCQLVSGRLRPRKVFATAPTRGSEGGA
jgi:tRNA pseudouridine55 synthase